MADTNTERFREDCTKFVIGACEKHIKENQNTGRILGFSDFKPLIKKPQTNADRIRAMSDEELGKFLGECKFCDICDEGCDNCTYHGDCDKRLLDWLKQPAEEE